MKKAANLQQLKGVGRVLSKRLQEMGLDSFEKIAQAGEEVLKNHRGLKKARKAVLKVL